MDSITANINSVCCEPVSVMAKMNPDRPGVNPVCFDLNPDPSDMNPDRSDQISDFRQPGLSLVYRTREISPFMNT